MPRIEKRPVCYLDIDDTLLREPPGGPVEAAPGAVDFLRFLRRHFEVRWLTRWCPDGREMAPEQLEWLERYGIPAQEVHGICNAGPFQDDRHAPTKWLALDLEEIQEQGRPFVWIEDDLSPQDRERLAELGLLDSFIECNVTEHPQRLREVKRILKQRLEQGDAAPAEDDATPTSSPHRPST